MLAATSLPLVIRTVTAPDLPAIASLNAMVFGPGRFARTASRVREAHPTSLPLSVLAERDGELVGAVLQSPVSVGGVATAFLGPIAVTEQGRRLGTGGALMSEALAIAAASGFAMTLLVGDPPYYLRFGFEPVPSGRITLPGPVDPARLLARRLDASLAELPAGPIAAPIKRRPRSVLERVGHQDRVVALGAC